MRVEPVFDGLPPNSAPALLKGAAAWGLRGDEARALIQDSDLRDYAINVRIDPDWTSTALREAMTAQIVEEFIRTGQSDLIDDAVLAWFLGWVARASGNHAESPLDLYEAAKLVAERSVRTPTPQAHRAFWRRSLGPRGQDVVAEAAQKVGISRRAAFDRLRRSGKRIADFVGEDDRVDAIGRLLDDSAPHRISEDRRLLRRVLAEAGLSPAYARKLEQRTRGLDPAEHETRIRRAIERQQGRGGAS